MRAIFHAARCVPCKRQVKRVYMDPTGSAGGYRLAASCHGKSWSQEFNISGMESSAAIRFLTDNVPRELFGGPWKGYERYSTTTRPERRKL